MTNTTKEVILERECQVRIDGISFMQGQQVAYKRSVTWVRDYLGIIVGLASRLVMQSKQLAAFMLTLHHAYPTGLAIEITLSSSAESKHYWRKDLIPDRLALHDILLHVNLQRDFADSDCEWHDTSPRNRYRCERGLSNMEYGSVPDPSSQTLYAI
ncbi:hypothetical protein BELL_0367g00080 [Botrytis elliptica]|uniref:Uncharacterized protein n=1 Tax=Botrytis elliptica TaxID=278938 RepID=A0A4Z1JP55_9HELO|nr:hypothetical protein BELL_0367g00080 [Botrytis elliptica]